MKLDKHQKRQKMIFNMQKKNKLLETRYSLLKKKYEKMKKLKNDAESQLDFFKQVFKETIKNSDNSKITEKACISAHRQIEDISHHIIHFSPARSFEKLKYYILSHFCDHLKIERPYADESVQNFCKSYRSEYTDTFLKTIEAAVKFFKDQKDAASDLYSMNVGDLIELLCFGNLRNMVLRHYEKHLYDKTKTMDSKEQMYTVPNFIKDITKAYESMREGCKMLGFKKSTSVVIPPICVLDVEALIASPSPFGYSPVPYITMEDQIASTYMHFISQRKMQQASIHPYQAIVSEIILFIHSSFVTDMQYMQKTSQFTISSLSNYLSKFI